jgi:hypothetical protein
MPLFACLHVALLPGTSTGGREKKKKKKKKGTKVEKNRQ